MNKDLSAARLVDEGQTWSLRKSIVIQASEENRPPLRRRES